MHLLYKLLSHKLSKEFVKFAFVGVINTLINMGVLYILVNYFSVYYMVAAILAFLVAVTNSFIMNTLWTFKSDIADKTHSKLSKFFLISTIAALFNLLFLYIFTEFLGIWYMLSQLFAIVLTLLINFIGNKLWTYR